MNIRRRRYRRGYLPHTSSSPPPFILAPTRAQCTSRHGRRHVITNNITLLLLYNDDKNYNYNKDITRMGHTVFDLYYYKLS